MESRYHPIIEDLKVNEDGTEIILGKETLRIKTYGHKHTRKEMQMVHINSKLVSVQKIVCEAWHGIAPTGENAARRVDELGGNHYSNLYWGKRGMTKSSAVNHKAANDRRKLTAEVYETINKRTANKEKLKDILKELDISHGSFYQYRYKHDEKEK